MLFDLTSSGLLYMLLAACSERTAEDQYVQGTQGQTCVHPELLQSYQ